MPEIDTPAHIDSWAVGRPDVVINCTANSYLSLLDPTVEATFQARCYQRETGRAEG
jgi:hypothetical protein